MNLIDDHFLQPDFLWLLLLIPVMFLWYIRKNKNFRGNIAYSGFPGLTKYGNYYKIVLWHIQHILRLLSIVLLIVALARPRTVSSEKLINTLGIDIILSIDISSSMLAEDLKPNRIGAAKEVATNFISKRPHDRIGLIAYSGIAFTQCPLTIDHSILETMLLRLKNNMVTDGTSIGDGLALAVERLRHSEAVTKIVILLTDGINNMGFIDPATAAHMAAEFGIKIYTVGVGSKGKAPFPVKTHSATLYDYIDVEIDEVLLETIAKRSGGKYFRAVDNISLQEIYNEIDTLERTKIEVSYHKNSDEHFTFFILLALGCFLTELLLKYGFVRMLP